MLEFGRSGSNLVIQAYQQIPSNIFIRSRSDIPIFLRSSAQPESPNMNQNDFVGGISHIAWEVRSLQRGDIMSRWPTERANFLPQSVQIYT
jgi:hypothetical protein